MVLVADPGWTGRGGWRRGRRGKMGVRGRKTANVTRLQVPYFKNYQFVRLWLLGYRQRYILIMDDVTIGAGPGDLNCVGTHRGTYLGKPAATVDKQGAGGQEQKRQKRRKDGVRRRKRQKTIPKKAAKGSGETGEPDTACRGAALCEVEPPPPRGLSVSRVN